MRTRYKPWAISFLTEHPEVLIQKEAKDDPFLHGGPLYLEIGAGKGAFLLSLALLHPKRAYLAVEKIPTIAGILAKKIKEADLTNIRLWPYDASGLQELLPSSSLKAIYLNFPDPWPKKRHTKRRLTSPGFLRLYDDLLKPDGVLFFRTDSQDLFTYTLETMKEEGWSRLKMEEEDALIMSEYEKRFRLAGKKICRACFQKGRAKKTPSKGEKDDGRT